MKSLRAVAPLAVFPGEIRSQIDSFVVGFESAKTRSNYRANLRAWFCWIDAGGIEGLAVERAHGEGYVRDLEAAGYLAGES